MRPRAAPPDRLKLALIAILVCGGLAIAVVTGFGVNRGRARLSARHFAESIGYQNSVLTKNSVSMKVEMEEYGLGHSTDARLKAALARFRSDIHEAVRTLERLKVPDSPLAAEAHRRFLDLFRFERDVVLPQLETIVGLMIDQEATEEELEAAAERMMGSAAAQEAQKSAAASAAAKAYLLSVGLPVQ